MSDHNQHTDSNRADSNEGNDNSSEVTNHADANHVDTSSANVSGTDSSHVDTSSADVSGNGTRHVEGTHSQDTTTTVDSANDGQSHIEATNDHGTTSSTATAAPVGGTLGSDGYEHQTADATHHDVQGAQTIQNAIQGSNGNDLITGGNQSDVLSGGIGSDVINGGGGDDLLVAGGSTDTGVNHLDGGAGNDILVAGGQKTSYFNDFIAANGTLNTTIHTDAKFSDIASIVDGTLSGLTSNVVNDFMIHSANGNDIILNFHAATDKIVLDHGLNGSDIQDSASLFNHLSVHGNNVSIDLGLGNSITLVGVDASNLSASDFIIV